MADHAHAVAAAFERCGIDAEVLPPSDRETLDAGMRRVSGKECYPCAITTGDMLKKALAPGFDPARSAFFMPSGSGPCRFGQYSVFHRGVLDDLGLEEVPVFAPNQDEGFYEALGAVGDDFVLHAWKGVVAIQLLLKCLHATRPYEQRPGSADELHRQHLERVILSLRGLDGGLENALRAARRDFEALPRSRGRKPRIGVVGEIFVRSNTFANEDLVRKIEALGGEAWLAPVEEWIYYTNVLRVRHSLAARDYAGAARGLLTRWVQRRVERGSARLFEGMLDTLHEPPTSAVLRRAAPYVHDSFEGEAVLSVGKAVDYAAKGADGVVNAMPFGCMPGTIVTALLRAVTRDHGLPVISVAYDGTASTTSEIQLEAFMAQAAARAAQAN
jgi:predicted nucleotide-binding protein (sugar kinase/HSP70/actin superfamily)